MTITRRDFLKALGVLTSAVTVAQFDDRLRAITRTLQGPQEWTLSFDEDELTDLIRRGMRVGGVTTNERGRPVLECTLEFETAYLWALATLTDPDGGEWMTVDGENWTCEDRRMIL